MKVRLRRDQAIRPQAPTKTPLGSHLLSKQLIDKSCTSKYISADPYIAPYHYSNHRKSHRRFNMLIKCVSQLQHDPVPIASSHGPELEKVTPEPQADIPRPNRVRTLTGKEIELDIEPDYKVNHPPALMHFRLLPARNHFTLRLKSHPQATLYPRSLNALILMRAVLTGFSDKGACRGEGGNSSCPATTDLRRQADVRNYFLGYFRYLYIIKNKSKLTTSH